MRSTFRDEHFRIGIGRWLRETIVKTGQSLEWPVDADEIALRTAGPLPRLHGPVVGGSSCSR